MDRLGNSALGVLPWHERCCPFGAAHGHFLAVEAMERLAAMGMEEDLRRAAGQIAAILVEDPTEE